MLDKKVFAPIDSSQGPVLKAPIRSHMFLRQKFDAEGNFEKLRARLVAGGNMQNRDEILYDSVSSPTAATPFVFAIAAIAAQENRHVITADIPVAYLNADNCELGITMILDPYLSEVIARLDPSYAQFRRSDGTTVVQVKIAIYGCIE